MFMMSWPKKLVFCCRASKMIRLSVFSSLQNRAMLKQHPTAASTQAMGAPFLQCRWQLHWGGPRWIAEWQSWGAQSLEDTYNGAKYYKMAYIIVWRHMICRPMCLLLFVVICVSLLTRVSSPMQWTSFHLSHAHPYPASFPGDAPSHNSIAQNLQGLRRSEERMGKDGNCRLDMLTTGKIGG